MFWNIYKQQFFSFFENGVMSGCYQKLYRKMHVKQGIVAIIIPQIVMAGAEKVASQLACGINGDRYEVHLIIINERKNNLLQKEIDSSGVQCHFYGRKERNPLIRKICQMQWIFKTLDRIKPDIIHTNLDYYFSWVYALVRKRKVITTFHSQPYRLKNFFTVNMYRLLQKKDLIASVMLSQSNVDEFRDIFCNDNRELFVIPNPVDIKKFTFPERRYESNEVVFTFVARFHPIKNHHMLIMAFHEVVKEIPNCRLCLAGMGELMEMEQEYVHSIGIESKVDFLGEVEDVPALLRRTDVGVVSSKSEAFSLVLVEAMASGLPVIVTDVGGMRDIVDENGIKVSNDNSQEFAEAMIRLAKDPRLRRRYGKRSLELAEKYEMVNIIKAYEDLYEKELNNVSANRHKEAEIN